MTRKSSAGADGHRTSSECVCSESLKSNASETRAFDVRNGFWKIKHRVTIERWLPDETLCVSRPGTYSVRLELILCVYRDGNG